MSEAHELIRQAESFGVRIGYTDGFTTATMPAIGDPDELDGIALQLSRSLAGVTSVAIARAQAARAAEFVGKLAFEWDHDFVGRILGFSGEVARISYAIDEGCESTVSPKPETLLVVMKNAGADRDAAGFPVEIAERTRELVAKLQSLGIRFSYVDGFVTVSAASSEAEMLKTIRELGAPPARAKSGRESTMVSANPWPGHMREIRRLVMARVRVARGKEFIGSAAISDAATASDLAPRGTIVDCAHDGMLIFSSESAVSLRPMRVQMAADRVLILLEPKHAEDGASQRDLEETAPSPARRSWSFGRGRRTARA